MMSEREWYRRVLIVHTSRGNVFLTRHDHDLGAYDDVRNTDYINVLRSGVGHERGFYRTVFLLIRFL